MYKIENVNFTFNQNNDNTVKGTSFLLENINLQIHREERWVCIGPSGIGKSTFLHLLCGLLKPQSGQILYKGEPLASPLKGVSVLMQNHNLFPWKSLLENVCLPLSCENYGIHKKEARKKALDLLRTLKIEKLAQQKPSTLSGGQKQRGAIARALITNPEFLLLDEPFSALDEITREELNQLLLEISQSYAMGYFLITHSLEEALLLGEKILLLSNEGIKEYENAFFNQPLETLEERDVQEYYKFRKILHTKLRQIGGAP